MRIPGLILGAKDAGIAWRSTSSPGVAWFLVAAEGGPHAGARAGATVLIRMEPGCGYAAHRHLDVEEVWILAGGYRDERGEYLQGEYVRYEPQSHHHPIALGDANQPVSETNPACLLLASARGGTEVLEA
ncbi:MAG TPA: cupin domain-containing protein [Planctomycetota bacterium]|nr:cupin domain-containing protein [Planctomycetota bacterium]